MPKIYIHYDERNHDPPLIEYWTEQQHNDYLRGRAYGFGDAVISGGDITCRAEMKWHRDQKAHIKLIEQRVTNWMNAQETASVVSKPDSPKKKRKPKAKS